MQRQKSIFVSKTSGPKQPILSDENNLIKEIKTQFGINLSTGELHFPDQSKILQTLDIIIRRLDPSVSSSLPEYRFDLDSEGQFQYRCRLLHHLTELYVLKEKIDSNRNSRSCHGSSRSQQQSINHIGDSIDWVSLLFNGSHARGSFLKILYTLCQMKSNFTQLKMKLQSHAERWSNDLKNLGENEGKLVERRKQLTTLENDLARLMEKQKVVQKRKEQYQRQLGQHQDNIDQILQICSNVLNHEDHHEFPSTTLSSTFSTKNEKISKNNKIRKL